MQWLLMLLGGWLLMSDDKKAQEPEKQTVKEFLKKDGTPVKIEKKVESPEDKADAAA